MVTFSLVVQAYHPTRVFTLVYQPFALITIFILTHFEARVNTRLRILTGYSLFFLLVLLIPIVSATLPYM
jgi:equilibrative nucleoside transporter 1/2/3